MADAIIHRGPDDDGYLDLPYLGLANRRLSIVGLADGKQPIGNEDRSVWCVFNGEFFEYREVRAKLEAKGHQIPHAHGHGVDPAPVGGVRRSAGRSPERPVRVLRPRHEEEDALPRPRSLRHLPAVLDGPQKGGHAYLLFASEIRSLLASGMVPAEPDLRGINQVFSYFAVPGPITCFKGVNLLPPGHCLKVKLGDDNPEHAIQERTYWELDFPDQGHEENPPERRSGCRVRTAVHSIGRSATAGRCARGGVFVGRRGFVGRGCNREQGVGPADSDVHHRRAVEGV